jgi:hypothetical protein
MVFVFTRGNDRQGYVQRFEGKTADELAEKVKVHIKQAEEDGWQAKLVEATDMVEVRK